MVAGRDESSVEDGDEEDEDDCGIETGHAYSIISVFTMEDSSNEEHRMLLMRNPRGSNSYTWLWNHEDSNWTDDLVE